MNLDDEVLAGVRALDCPVKRICIGLHWAVVESRFTGIAHTFKPGHETEYKSFNSLIGKSAFAIAERLKSPVLFEAGLAVAALNSLIEPSGRPGNIFGDIFGMIAGKTVTVVGRFPINKEIAEVAGRLYVLEREPQEGELPADACEEVIPKSDIVIISGSALINHSLPRLLELSVAAKAKAFVIGPTTPMSDVLISHGAYMLGGVRVMDTDALIQSVKEGARYSKELAGTVAIVKQ